MVWARSGRYGQLVVSADGRTVASHIEPRKFKGELTIFRRGQQKPLCRMRTLAATPRLAMSADGRTLVLPARKTKTLVVDSSSCKVRAELAGHPDLTTSAAIDAASDLVVTSGRGGEVRFWKLSNGALKATLKLDRRINDVVLAPGATWLACGGERRVVTILNVQTRKTLRRLPPQAAPIMSLAVSKDGDRLAAGLWNGRVVIWDTRRWEVVLELQAHASVVTRLQFSSKRSHLATSSYDDHRIWPLKKVEAGLSGVGNLQEAQRDLGMKLVGSRLVPLKSRP